jgi:hypothetical protein
MKRSVHRRPGQRKDGQSGGGRERDALSRRGGRLSPSAQVKVLRVLEEKEYFRVGSVEKKADVRIIAATNKDLESEVKKGISAMISTSGSTW